MSGAIDAGARAPSFSLPSQNGTEVSLEALLGRGPVVLFFYPKDETSGCTAEACAFRDHYDAFQEAGASVVGVSDDAVASHRRFAERHGFPFALLSDAGGALRKAYGVPRAMGGLLKGRTTYVIDRGGVVRYVFTSLINATRHVEEALRVVRALA
jgi:peroxiredoxin Q/BCP